MKWYVIKHKPTRKIVQFDMVVGKYLLDIEEAEGAFLFKSEEAANMTLENLIIIDGNIVLEDGEFPIDDFEVVEI